MPSININLIGKEASLILSVNPGNKIRHLLFLYQPLSVFLLQIRTIKSPFNIEEQLPLCREEESPHNKVIEAGLNKLVDLR